MAYVNECLTQQSIRQILDCFCRGVWLYIEFTQSHRPKVSIIDPYDKYEPGLKQLIQCVGPNCRAFSIPQCVNLKDELRRSNALCEEQVGGSQEQHQTKTVYSVCGTLGPNVVEPGIEQYRTMFCCQQAPEKFV